MNLRRAFTRETDALCFWGHYGAALFAARGGVLPPTRIDLRHVARGYAKRKVGTLEELLAALDSPRGPALTDGRAGARLEGLARLVRRFGGVSAAGVTTSA